MTTRIVGRLLIVFRDGISRVQNASPAWNQQTQDHLALDASSTACTDNEAKLLHKCMSPASTIQTMMQHDQSKDAEQHLNIVGRRPTHTHIHTRAPVSMHQQKRDNVV